MKLTQDQIEELFRFTRAHYVEYYDLQLELVDHLANGIEKQWEEKPGLTFEEAKNLEFKKFGVFGFEDVIAQRRKAMSKRYRGIIWKYLTEWFLWPKILITTFLIVGIALILNQVVNEESKLITVMALSILLVFSSFAYFFWTRKDRELNMVKGGKKLILSEMIYNFGDIIHINNLLLQVGIWIMNTQDYSMHTYWFDITFATVWVLLCLVSYIAIILIPSQAEELLAETYPEYKISQSL